MKKKAWLFIQHVAMNCRHLDDQRIDLIARHQKIASDGSFAWRARRTLVG
jgi:hypothetical protein